MTNLERLLDPATVEAWIDDVSGENGPLDAIRIYRDAIRELVKRNAAAKAEGVREALLQMADRIDKEHDAEDVDFFKGILTTADLREEASK